MESEELERGVVGSDEGGRRKKRLMEGDYISRLSLRDWTFLTDLYFCRCMPQSAAVETFFLDAPEIYYPEYQSATPERKLALEEKNRKRAVRKAQKKANVLNSWGLIEMTYVNPDELDKPVHLRRSVRAQTWYYLTSKGLRVVEKKIRVSEESSLSKLELDIDRANKEHVWELGKVYLDLRYTMANFHEHEQFKDWAWHPAMSVYSDNHLTKGKEIWEVRPDAILRITEQVFYIELDRSTEPVQRSPFYTDQVSIKNKLERYRDVMKNCTNSIKRSGIIAFIVPDAIYDTRLKNIIEAADMVFTKKEVEVKVGRTIRDIIGQVI
jgi:hypothetical protein